jgi:hypothetical protein
MDNDGPNFVGGSGDGGLGRGRALAEENRPRSLLEIPSQEFDLGHNIGSNREAFGKRH